MKAEKEPSQTVFYPRWLSFVRATHITDTYKAKFIRTCNCICQGTHTVPISHNEVGNVAKYSPVIRTTSCVSNCCAPSNMAGLWELCNGTPRQTNYVVLSCVINIHEFYVGSSAGNSILDVHWLVGENHPPSPRFGVLPVPNLISHSPSISTLVKDCSSSDGSVVASETVAQYGASDSHQSQWWGWQRGR